MRAGYVTVFALLIIVAGCQTTPETILGYPLFKDSPYSGDNVLDIVERLEDPEERKKFISELHWWPQRWAVEMNAWTMTALSIVDRRGYINEVPPKLRAQYYLHLIKPVKNIEGWKNWRGGHCHADWWRPFVTQESDKTIFHEFWVGCNDAAIAGLCDMGVDAIPYILDYMAQQETQRARVLALFCLEGIIGRQFDISKFLNQSNWKLATEEMRKWWQTAKHKTKKEIARNSLAETNLMVRIGGAKQLIAMGVKDGLKALIEVLREMTANFEEYVNRSIVWEGGGEKDGSTGREKAFLEIQVTVRDNLGGIYPHNLEAEERERSLREAEKFLRENWDRLVFDEKEKRFKLPAKK